ncbi:MAG TPA: hypothetical protein PLQ33_07115 [Peptococcaceae bacterium]|nr:hypothetical protein [Peptococcaceae bacterium]
MDELVALFGNILNQIFGLEGDIQSIINLVREVPNVAGTSDGTIYNYVLTVFNIILPIGYTLMCVFFMISFLNKTIMFELMHWENIVSMLIRLFLAKVVIVNSFALLELIATVVVGICDTLAPNNPDLQGFSRIANWNSMIDQILNEFRDIGLIAKIFYFIQYFVIWAVMLLIRIAVYFVVFGRLIELCVYTIMAPIPLSTMVSDEFNSIAFRFVQSYIAVCLQGVVIVVLCYVYLMIAARWINPGDGVAPIAGVIAYVLSSVALLFALLKSESWAKAIMGL